jgi:hypothetical protein
MAVPEEFRGFFRGTASAHCSKNASDIKQVLYYLVTKSVGQMVEGYP